LRERFGIEGPAGIWAYFLAHSMDFLVQGGRIASTDIRRIPSGFEPGSRF
jgi:hypothetical protein